MSKELLCLQCTLPICVEMLNDRNAQCAYRISVREERRRYYQIYYWQNREKKLQAAKQWAKDNAEKHAEHSRNYRQRQREEITQ